MCIAAYGTSWSRTVAGHSLRGILSDITVTVGWALKTNFLQWNQVTYAYHLLQKVTDNITGPLHDLLARECGLRRITSRLYHLLHQAWWPSVVAGCFQRVSLRVHHLLQDVYHLLQDVYRLLHNGYHFLQNVYYSLQTCCTMGTTCCRMFIPCCKMCITYCRMCTTCCRMCTTCCRMCTNCCRTCITCCRMCIPCCRMCIPSMAGPPHDLLLRDAVSIEVARCVSPVAECACPAWPRRTAR